MYREGKHKLVSIAGTLFSPAALEPHGVAYYVHAFVFVICSSATLSSNSSIFKNKFQYYDYVAALVTAAFLVINSLHVEQRGTCLFSFCSSSFHLI